MGPPRLIASEGGRTVQVLELRAERERWLIGRSLESDMCVEHASLSRKHCAISRASDGSFYLTDLGSVHGTHYEGQTLAPDQPMRLFDGVVVTLGQSAREYTTEGVPLIPVPPQAANGASADGDAPVRVVKGAAPRPEGMAAAVDNAERENAAGEEAEMQELFGLPLTFGKAGGPAAGGAAGAGKGGRAEPQPAKAKPARRGQPAKLSLGANLGKSLGVTPDAPAPPAPDPAAEAAAEAAAAAAAAASAGRGRGAAEARRAAAAALPPPADVASAQMAQRVGPALEQDDDDELIGPPLPPGLLDGAQGGGEAGGDEEEEEDFIGPPLPRPAAGGAGADSSEEEDDDEEEGEDAAGEAALLDRFRLLLPSSHRVEMAGAAKTVTCLGLDGAGSRMVSGSADHSLRLYDFHGMAADLRPFRTLEEPLGSCQLRSISWSPTSSHFALGGSSPQPKLFSREAAEVSTLMRGDMYLRDLRHTKGHIAAVTCVRWHPVDSGVLATCGEDSSVRLWDTHAVAARNDRTALTSNSGQTAILALKDAKGQRTAVSAIDWCARAAAPPCAWGGSAGPPCALRAGGSSRCAERCPAAPAHGLSPFCRAAAAAGVRRHVDGRSVALSTLDGCIHLWDSRQHGTAPQLSATGAHTAGCAVTWLQFAPAAAGSAAGHLLASRGGAGDDCLRLWDLRMVRAAAAAATLGGGRSGACEALAEWGGLKTLYANTPCVWSPNGALLATGAARVERSSARHLSAVAPSARGCSRPSPFTRPRLPVRAAPPVPCSHFGRARRGGRGGRHRRLLDTARRRARAARERGRARLCRLAGVAPPAQPAVRRHVDRRGARLLRPWYVGEGSALLRAQGGQAARGRDGRRGRTRSRQRDHAARAAALQGGAAALQEARPREGARERDCAQPADAAAAGRGLGRPRDGQPDARTDQDCRQEPQRVPRRGPARGAAQVRRADREGAALDHGVREDATEAHSCKDR